MPIPVFATASINLDSRLKMPILVNPESERASSVLG